MSRWPERRTVRLDRSGVLRAVDVLRRTTGLRVEIAGLARPRPGRCVGILRDLEFAFAESLPWGRVALHGVSIRMAEYAGEADGWLSPDLAVCPRGFLVEESTLLRPQDVDIAVQVTDAPAPLGRYAGAGVPAVVLVDPVRCRWAVYTHPGGGSYRERDAGAFGDVMVLPVPFGLRVRTDRWRPG
ncbi:Uma2 family endonuclease [Streptomyces sp. 549]|uniref:Uma2 family endonuclease n=1 Tax=Streptomyces sp. 549 TaxID=3049076 RepID=UPI0024C2F50D|nr:Uma2 family endonuclease [Streptomyces sp. 549]MDK1476233.1 Uma2 family endonuclease [Streptomyces sp. 549]